MSRLLTDYNLDVGSFINKYRRNELLDLLKQLNIDVKLPKLGD